VFPDSVSLHPGYGTDTFEVDRIIPQALGDKTELNNLCYSCPVCNNAKRSHIAARDPQTGRKANFATASLIVVSAPPH
jgi:5-methylcytosine-specific restriction endonuclease McrA